MSCEKKDSVIISVIMSVRNSEKNISDSILSILNQTYFDFEFIIVDDCSNDNTWNIILSFSDNRVIAIKNEKNIGIFPSLNIAIKKAKGKYIAIMDESHIAMPDRLWKQLYYMENNREVLALGAQFECSNPDLIIKMPIHFDEICAELLNGNCFLHSSLFIRSEIMNQSG